MAYEDVFRSIKVKSGKVGLMPDTITHSLIGTVAENSFPHHASTQTALAAGYAKVYDLSAEEYEALSDSSDGAGYTADFQVYPDSEAAGDYAVFGVASPTGIIYFDVSVTVATWSGDGAKWQYWNGTAWADLTVYDGTDSTAQDGLRPFQVDGFLVFDPPSDWAASTIDSQVAYWIRSVITAATMTQAPLLEDEHKTSAFSAPFIVPYDMNIDSITFQYITNSGTTADTKFQLYSLTDKKNLKTLTVTKALHKGVKVTVDVEVEANDQLVLFCVQEEGSTEYANGTATFTVTRK
jgi:hypothetical protein